MNYHSFSTHTHTPQTEGAASLCASSVALWGTRRIFGPSDGAAAGCSHPGTRPATAEDEGEAAEEDQADFARDETGHAPL